METVQVTNWTTMSWSWPHVETKISFLNRKESWLEKQAMKMNRQSVRLAQFMKLISLNWDMGRANHLAAPIWAIDHIGYIDIMMKVQGVVCLCDNWPVLLNSGLHMCKAGRYIWFMAKISSDWDFEFPNPRWRKSVLWALTDRWAPKSSLVHLAKILTSVDFGVQREGSNLRNRQK